MGTTSLSDAHALGLMASMDDASNLWGPLRPGVRARLYAVAENPTQETWEDAHGIILRADDGWGTLWQALLRFTTYDVTSHSHGEPWSLPTSQQIVLAIRGALS